jgi:RISC-loading complex subunit TARBP2
VNPHYADLKESKIATLNTKHGIKVSQFHKNLKSATGDKLNELQVGILMNS